MLFCISRDKVHTHLNSIYLLFFIKIVFLKPTSHKQTYLSIIGLLPAFIVVSQMGCHMHNHGWRVINFVHFSISGRVLAIPIDPLQKGQLFWKCTILLLYFANWQLLAFLCRSGKFNSHTIYFITAVTCYYMQPIGEW